MNGIYIHEVAFWRSRMPTYIVTEKVDRRLAQSELGFLPLATPYREQRKRGETFGRLLYQRLGQVTVQQHSARSGDRVHE